MTTGLQVPFTVEQTTVQYHLQLKKLLYSLRKCDFISVFSSRANSLQELGPILYDTQTLYLFYCAHK